MSFTWCRVLLLELSVHREDEINGRESYAFGGMLGCESLGLGVDEKLALLRLEGLFITNTSN